MTIRLLRLTRFMWRDQYGTRVPKTSATWRDAEGVIHVETMDGEPTPAEVLYQLGGSQYG